MGRDPSNEIAISDPQVSRLHARVYLSEGMLVVEDMGSTNGTFVNGVPLAEPKTLAPGDVIGLGDAVTLTYYSSGVVATTPLGDPGLGSPRPEPEAQSAAAASSASSGRVGTRRPTAAGRDAPKPLAMPPQSSQGASWDDRPLEDEDDDRTRRRKYMLVGCGCLALMLACAAVALFLWYAPASFWEFLVRLGVPIPPNPF
jgi:hypothetical protein